MRNADFRASASLKTQSLAIPKRGFIPSIHQRRMDCSVISLVHEMLFATAVLLTLVRLNTVNSEITQVNRMSRSRRVLAIGGKQRINGLDMVCIETILFHLESF